MFKSFFDAIYERLPEWKWPSSEINYDNENTQPLQQQQPPQQQQPRPPKPDHLINAILYDDINLSDPLNTYTKEKIFKYLKKCSSEERETLLNLAFSGLLKAMRDIKKELPNIRRKSPVEQSQMLLILKKLKETSEELKDTFSDLTESKTIKSGATLTFVGLASYGLLNFLSPIWSTPEKMSDQINQHLSETKGKLSEEISNLNEKVGYYYLKKRILNHLNKMDFKELITKHKNFLRVLTLFGGGYLFYRANVLFYNYVTAPLARFFYLNVPYKKTGNLIYNIDEISKEMEKIINDLNNVRIQHDDNGNEENTDIVIEFNDPSRQTLFGQMFSMHNEKRNEHFCKPEEEEDGEELEIKEEDLKVRKRKLSNQNL